MYQGRRDNLSYLMQREMLQEGEFVGVSEQMVLAVILGKGRTLSVPGL